MDPNVVILIFVLLFSKCSLVTALRHETGSFAPLIYKGCFHTDFVQTYGYYYRIKESLPVSNAIAACNNRLTRYIGLQTDIRSPSQNIVFCGNDLPQVSQEAKSWCLPCKYEEGLSCGGRSTMAVYMLRETTPFAVLLGTDRGVELLVDKNTTLLVDAIGSKFKSFDYIYDDDTIMTRKKGQLVQYVYNYFQNKYTFSKNFSRIRSVGVDFKEKVLYWNTWNDSAIDKYALRTHEQTRLTTSCIPHYMSIDPFRRVIFFICAREQNVFYYEMDTQAVKNVSTAHLNVATLFTLAVDIHQQLLYATVDLKDNGVRCLISMDYNISQMSVLYTGTELYHISHHTSCLDVFNGTVVWIKEGETKMTVYKCTLTPKCLPDNLSVIYSSYLNLTNIKIYHPEKQTPGEKWLCSKKNCTHGCKTFSPLSVNCSCSEELESCYEDSTCKGTAAEPTEPDLTDYSSTVDFDTTEWTLSSTVQSQTEETVVISSEWTSPETDYSSTVEFDTAESISLSSEWTLSSTVQAQTEETVAMSSKWTASEFDYSRTMQSDAETFRNVSSEWIYPQFEYENRRKLNNPVGKSTKFLSTMKIVEAPTSTWQPPQVEIVETYNGTVLILLFICAFAIAFTGTLLIYYIINCGRLLTIKRKDVADPPEHHELSVISLQHL